MKLRWYFIICIPIGLIALLFIGIVLVVGAEHEDRYAREGRELRERGPIHTLKLWKQYYRANALIDANTDKGYTPPPERHPNEITGNCPPVAKLPADMLVLLPPDTDSADAPWFMGSWAFGDRDIVLEVEVWSVRGGGRVVGNSFISVPYTKSWSTSGALKGTYIPIRSPIWVSPLSPGSIPLCPFSGGVSLSSGLIGDGYDKIPKRLAWISGNPHIFGDPMPEVESMQLIVAPRGDGSPKFSDQGTISRTEAGTYGFSGKSAEQKLLRVLRQVQIWRPLPNRPFPHGR